MDVERLVPSGRRVEGPTASLIELHHQGHVWNALVHHEPYRRPELIDQVLQDARAFLEDPAVEGIVELDKWDREAHRLLYPTQRVWTLAELLQGAREARQPLGLRAGLEIAYLGGLVLQEGAEAGDDRGAPLHGAISPWTVVCDDDGDFHLLGWGMPPLALYAMDDDPDLELPDDVYRYCPPERVRGDDEDLSSDLFALGLIAVEAMIGAPLYGGSTEIRHQAVHCDAERRLYRYRDQLPEDVRLFMGRVLDPYRDARHDDIEDYLEEAHDLLYGPLTSGMPTLLHGLNAYGRRGDRLPRIPEAGAPKWRTPDETRRWDRPRRSAVERRPTRTPDDPEVAHALAPRAAPRPTTSPTDALRERLSQSSHEREDALRQRLTRTSSRTPRAPVRDRNGLFPQQRLSGEVLRFLVELPSGGTVWTRLSPDETLALSAARVADKACPTPVDPTGRLTGWFRLEQGGGGWFGDTKTSVLSADDPVQLAFVPNRIVAVQLLVEGHEDAPVDLEIGTAVHVQFLLSHFRQRFHLRARDWELWAEESRPLDRWQVLDDHDPSDGLVLRMRRARAHRRSLRRR